MADVMREEYLCGGLCGTALGIYDITGYSGSPPTKRAHLVQCVKLKSERLECAITSQPLHPRLGPDFGLDLGPVLRIYLCSLADLPRFVPGVLSLSPHKNL